MSAQGKVGSVLVHDHTVYIVVARANRPDDLKKSTIISNIIYSRQKDLHINRLHIFQRAACDL